MTKLFNYKTFGRAWPSPKYYLLFIWYTTKKFKLQSNCFRAKIQEYLGKNYREQICYEKSKTFYNVSQLCKTKDIGITNWSTYYISDG